MAQAIMFAVAAVGLSTGKISAINLCQIIVRKKVVPKNPRWGLMFRKIVLTIKTGTLFHFAKIVMQKLVVH